MIKIFFSLSKFPFFFSFIPIFNPFNLFATFSIFNYLAATEERYKCPGIKKRLKILSHCEFLPEKKSIKTRTLSTLFMFNLTSYDNVGNLKQFFFKAFLINFFLYWCKFFFAVKFLFINEGNCSAWITINNLLNISFVT